MSTWRSLIFSGAFIFFWKNPFLIGQAVYILLFIIIKIKKRLKYSKAKIFLILFFLFFSLFHILNEANNWLSLYFFVESKILFSIFVFFIIYLLRVKENLPKLTAYLLIGLIVYNITHLIDANFVWRFSERIPGTLPSSYQGFVLVFLTFFQKSRALSIVGLTIGLWTLSSSVIIAYAGYICANLILRRKRYIKAILTILGLCILFLLFLASLEYRGRSFSEFVDIDRIALLAATFSFVIFEGDIFSILFGHGLTSSVVPVLNYLDDNLAAYFLSTRDDIPTASVLHSDFLRVFWTLGCVGVLFYYGTLYLLSRKNLPVFFFLTIYSFANTIVYSFPVFAVLIIVSCFGGTVHSSSSTLIAGPKDKNQPKSDEYKLNAH